LESCSGGFIFWWLIEMLGCIFSITCICYIYMIV
jgi:hypothetical protein